MTTTTTVAMTSRNQRCKLPKDKPLKAYKGFHLKDGKHLECRGMRFEIGKAKTIRYSNPVSVCNSGFHACEKLINVLEFYGNIAENAYCEVEQWGDIHHTSSFDKHASRHIKVIRRLTIKEFFEMTNTSKTDPRIQINSKELIFTLKYNALDSQQPVMVINRKKGATIFLPDEDFNHIVITESPGIVIGQGNLVKGCIGSTFIDTGYNIAMLIDGKKFKADVFYKIENGKFTLAQMQ